MHCGARDAPARVGLRRLSNEGPLPSRALRKSPQAPPRACGSREPGRPQAPRPRRRHDPAGGPHGKRAQEATNVQRAGEADRNSTPPDEHVHRRSAGDHAAACHRAAHRGLRG